MFLALTTLHYWLEKRNYDLMEKRELKDVNISVIKIEYEKMASEQDMNDAVQEHMDEITTMARKDKIDIVVVQHAYNDEILCTGKIIINDQVAKERRFFLDYLHKTCDRKMFIFVTSIALTYIVQELFRKKEEN